MTAVENGKPTQMKAMKVTKPYAPALPDLTPAQELALLARCLFSEGYDDHLAGHITYKQPDGTFLVNPFGLTWDELRASEAVRGDGAARAAPGPHDPGLTDGDGGGCGAASTVAGGGSGH
jgi:hypothetical protein